MTMHEDGHMFIVALLKKKKKKACSGKWPGWWSRKTPSSSPLTDMAKLQLFTEQLLIKMT